VIAKKYAGQTDKKEEWYGTEYKLEPIPQEKLKVIQTHKNQPVIFISNIVYSKVKIIVVCNLKLSKYEPCHEKTNIMGLRPAWIQTSLCIRTV
jgi:hypothetical protein